MAARGSGKPLKLGKLILIVLWSLFAIVGVYDTASFGHAVLRQASRNEAAADGDWRENRVPFTTMPATQALSTEFEQAVVRRIAKVTDSIHALYDYADNIPDGYAPVGWRQLVEPTGSDDTLKVLVVAEYRLKCDCDNPDNFWLLRLRIDPLTWEVEVCTDNVNNWQVYVPQYRVIS